jgi:putative nucleotidyltransferase with HDIG domain
MEEKTVLVSTDNKLMDDIIISMFKRSKVIKPVVVPSEKLLGSVKNNKPDMVIIFEELGIYKLLKEDKDTADIPVISILFEPSKRERIDNRNGDKTWILGSDIEGLYELVISSLPIRRKRIMLIDDEEVIHNVIKNALKGDRYEIFSMYEGDTAIRDMSRIKPDLVITDITMPGMDGLQVCMEIKSNSDTSGIPVMIVSAHADDQIIEKGFNAGADEYITKPFSMEELVSKVESVLNETLNKRKEKILIVDDSPTVISVLKNGISKEGFTIITASDGDEGLQKAIAELPDIIISDIEMPRMNGFEFCKQIKANQSTRHIPFVALTSKGSRGARGLGKRAGINAYLLKPFTIEKVVVIIERFLAEKREILEIERDLMLASISSLAKALDERDNYTRYHSENVAKYAVMIASSIGLSKEEIEKLRLAAILHDIGKIGIRDEILLKKSELSPEEYKMIQEHPEKGAAILQPIPSLKDIIPYILYHHEKYDGKGLKGLKGEDIPLGARILAVADAYDALTTDRPYRKCLEKDDAIKIIRENSGKHFCPDCVENFLKIFDPAHNHLQRISS